MNPIKIIACLDVKDGRVVKGVNFVNFKDAGDPAEAAARYEAEGADEVVLLDIAATVENRQTFLDVIAKTSKMVKVPFAVGGGMKTVEEIEAVLNAGADKISINSAAVKNPQLIADAAQKFGSAKIIVAIDVAKNEKGTYDVYVDGGFKNTGIDAVEWAKQAQKLGAGEILLTSINEDGKKQGYDLEITKKISDAVKIPVTASGGAGTMEHMYEAVVKGGASAVLGASVFHFGIINIKELKKYLKSKGVPIICPGACGCGCN